MERNIRIGPARAALALLGLAVAGALGWTTLSAGDLTLVFGRWLLPAVVLLHLVQQAGCGCAWHNLLGRARPTRWEFFRIRWVRASVAALVPVSGVGAALVAIRLAMKAGLRMDVASASLTHDATIEIIAQLVFTAVGLGLLMASAPQPGAFAWSAAVLALGGFAVAAFVGVQRAGGLKLVEAALRRLAERWPGLVPAAETRLHDQLMQLHRQPRATLVSGLLHLGCWLLGAGEIWLAAFAVGHPLSPANCVILESLTMIARSAGFFLPGAIGVQEVALALLGKIVGLPAETAILIAVVKRVRDVVVGIPGLLIWQWAEAAPVITPQPTAD